MSRGRQRLADYLSHVIEAIERIGSYTAGLDEAAFLSNRLVQDAVVRNFEIIGEASHNIETRYPEFAAAHPELPLAYAYQMRNVVAHGYFKVDCVLVSRTIRHELPGLHARLLEAAAGTPGDSARG